MKMAEQPAADCKMIDDCNHDQTAETCNPSCEFYNPVNGKVPEEIELKAEEQIKAEDKNPNDINLKISAMEKFDKLHEFVVLKRHVFQMQSISPKKIILKFKRKLKETDKIQDGCFVFVDKDDKLLLPEKVFKKFTEDARQKMKNESVEKEKKIAEERIKEK